MNYYVDMQHDDLNYEYLYGTTYPLMKNAGKAVADAVMKNYPDARTVCVVAGTGNNGGDAIVAGSILSAKYDVRVLIVTEVRSELARRALSEYGGRVIGLDGMEECMKCDVIIDGIFGVGISGDPKDPYRSVIENINRSCSHVVSVDIPSGLGTRYAVKPEITVTFTMEKYGMNQDNSGKIIVADIGIPPDVRKYAGPGDLLYYPKPDPSSHKGMNGTLAIVGGWEFHGSSVIAALAAERIGLDLVRVFVSPRNYQIVSGYDPGIIVRQVEKLDEKKLSEIYGNSAILLGPGMGKGDDAMEAARKIVSDSRVPMVVDADALDAVGAYSGSFAGRKIIITPHKGEFRRISGFEPTEENAISYARKKGLIVVLKGQVDVITNGEEVHYAKGGNARMTMGGTGDLLAGIISAFLARSVDPMRACLMGTYLNKALGEAAYSKHGYWYTVTDMISEIPGVMGKYIKI
ncbi:bifunctional ADP-dependent NAD(P)H-hydrate dehydratase/NAD(P)H-hydrate epimerase [Thermoplasma acidophilum]|uniref:bifunctional ADP-dependent NAD(P)H-hydrate dehydratase/NAD(P)H-hydrate epimerase n=1 Tax=Thermoplasma acidophilum TaxID=2303 RepID=UPI00064FD63B|nr:bifunctional ADP-dependent NAD(P)H-hydrate dehydratase/NAD(P)H-hydrate epimerase [Thermoplasma acidophilum]